jgi:hypothetical protein
MAYSRHLEPIQIGTALVLVGFWCGAPSAVAAELGTPVPAPASASSMPDLSGVWTLDPKASDDLKAFTKTLESLRPSGGRRDTGGPGGGQGESVRGGEGARGGPGAGIAKGALQLLISVDGEAIEIVDAAERTETWVPDGEARAPEGPGGRRATHRAVWQEGVLVLEQLGGPLTLTRRLRLSDDGQRLLVDLSVSEAEGKSVTAHLEYVGVK